MYFRARIKSCVWNSNIKTAYRYIKKGNFIISIFLIKKEKDVILCHVSYAVHFQKIYTYNTFWLSTVLTTGFKYCSRNYFYVVHLICTTYMYSTTLHPSNIFFNTSLHKEHEAMWSKITWLQTMSISGRLINEHRKY